MTSNLKSSINCNDLQIAPNIASYIFWFNMGDRAGSVLAQSCNSVVSTDDGAGAGGEELLEEEQPAPTTQQRIKSFLRKNWRNILVLMCLCVTVSLCAIAFSLMAPFFPKEV